MANNPAGQSCATCAFYIGGTCRVSPPAQSLGAGNLWASTGPDDWCNVWNVWPAVPPTPAGAVCTAGTIAPSGGANGDFYVDYLAFNGTILQKQTGVWVTIQTINSVGTTGAVCTSGTSAPSGGADGDFYALYVLDFSGLTISALKIYQRQAGVWAVIQTIL